MGAEEDICAPMIQQTASPASLSPPGQEQLARRSIYSVSNDFSRTGKYHAKKQRRHHCAVSVLSPKITFPVRETGLNDKIFTSAGALSPPYFLCTSSYTSVIAFKGASVTLLTMTLTARLIRKAGSSS